MGFRLSVLPKSRPGQCLRFAGGQEGGLSPGRVVPTAFRPTKPRPFSPPPCAAPTRPARSVSGIWIRQVLFLHSVYIRFRLFVLLGGRSGDVFTMPRGIRGTLVSWADCSVGVRILTDPAPPPRRSAVRSNPTRPWYVRVLDSTGLVLRHLCF